MTIDSNNSKTVSLQVLGVFGKYSDHPDIVNNVEKKVGLYRYRLDTNPESADYERAYFNKDGLVWHDEETGEKSPHWFWHMSDLEGKERSDRAILFQSLENYETLATQPHLAPHMHLSDKLSDTEKDKPLDIKKQKILQERVLDNPTFGEQIIVEGATPSSISLGDIFEVSGGSSTLKVQVTSPRLPCYEVDGKNKTSRGKNGAKMHCMPRGLAGWFTSVLVAGEIRDGMTLVRTHHPHPEWTLEELSKALYGGEGDPKKGERGKASWGRSRRELRELMNNETLAPYEWKNEMKKLPEAESGGVFGYFADKMADLLESCNPCGALDCSAMDFDFAEMGCIPDLAAVDE